MQFEVTILGSNAAIPAADRHPSAQILNINNHLYLIDCGEGTQIRMNQYGIRRHRIHQIFISHLHGDHVFGLIGLLTSYSLNKRTERLTLFSPAGLQEMIEVQLRITQSYLSYPLEFIVVDPNIFTEIFSDDTVSVFTLPLLHRIPACGYLFKEHPRPLNIVPEQLEKYGIPFNQINDIKNGKEGLSEQGEVIDNQLLTLPAYRQRMYAYCSDTMYNPDLIPLLNEVDLLYHESTFAEDKAAQAVKTMHSTAKQAAEIAVRADVNQLLIGHFSSRYLDLKVLLKEAKSVFENTALAVEGQTFSVELRRENNIDLKLKD